MNRSLVTRLIIFSVLFIGISGWYGSLIIGTPLLYPFYFFIYGNLGKVLLFSFISFVFLAWKKLKDIHIPKYNKKNLLFLLLGLLATPLFVPIGQELLKYSNASENILLTILGHLLIVGVPLLFALGIFGVKFLKRFIRHFRTELLICLALATALYFSIFYVWTLWPYLSDIVLRCVTFLFSLTFDNVVVFPPRTVFVEKFAVTIDQACSGLESFLLFTGLSGLILYIDRKKINFRKFALFYTFGFLGAFIVNILRVYAIIWAGLVFSPDIAATLFHTYLGMIFFIVYFMIYLKVSYKSMHT